MLDKNKWFTESCTQFGTAFSLQIETKLHEEKTPFQTIGIYETTHFGKLMTIDNIIMLSARDNFFYHEMMTHPVLFTHKHPKDVVIIGGGDCGTLKEVLKHPIDSVVQVEIDERVTQLAEKYFPELCIANQDPRAQFLFLDGIAWMIDAADHSVDVIIVDSTDPIGPAEGLFNTAFYKQCFRVLREDGILIHQSESPLLHLEMLKAIRAAMQSAGFKDLLTVPFPQTVYPSGWHSATMAAKKPLLKSFRRDEALLKKLNTHYYNFAVHEAALTPVPMLQKAFR